MLHFYFFPNFFIASKFHRTSSVLFLALFLCYYFLYSISSPFHFPAHILSFAFSFSVVSVILFRHQIYYFHLNVAYLVFYSLPFLIHFPFPVYINSTLTFFFFCVLPFHYLSLFPLYSTTPSHTSLYSLPLFFLFIHRLSLPNLNLPSTSLLNAPNQFF